MMYPILIRFKRGERCRRIVWTESLESSSLVSIYLAQHPEIAYVLSAGDANVYLDRDRESFTNPF